MELLLADDLVPDRSLRPEDRDLFEFEALAGRIAELAVHGDMPLNIALFGPWGSGKSSLGELIRRDVSAGNARRKAPQIRFVPYEAWRYTDESLKRHFIAHVAGELDFSREKYAQYYEGLYEERRTFEIRWRRAIGLAVRGAFLLAGLIGVVIVLLMTVDAIQALAQDRSFRREFRETAGQLEGTFQTGAVIIAALALLLPFVRAEVKQSAPSADEEFIERFRDLIRDACSEHGFDRILFFIDELDRCSPEDVVEVLTSIKTFLNHERCVFVVAADRQVIEEALHRKLKQATAVNVESPYHTSASSFLEKIFQHEVSVPPLRARRLTAFALELVTSRGGLWQELRRERRGDRKLQRVAVALVPSHLRSPRQVKQLLNNYATRMRIAQARGLAYLDRAEEIAKLTVLETEFPGFALAARRDPRLLRATSADEIRSHDLGSELEAVRLENLASADHTDASEGLAISPLLRQGSRELREAQFAQLLRYLQRTAGVPGPRSDLFYLGPAAPELDPDDPTLGDLLETVAPDDPDAVVEAVRERPESVRLRVLAFLSEMSDRTFAGERAGVMSALAQIAETISGDWTVTLQPMGPSVEAYALDQVFQRNQLPGALRLARVAEGGQGGRVTRIILQDHDMWDDPAIARRVLADADFFGQDALRLMAEGISDSIPAGLGTLIAAIETVSISAWLEMRPVVAQAIATRLNLLAGDGNEEGSGQLAASVLDAAQRRREDFEPVGADLVSALVGSGNATAYRVARDRAEETLTR